MQGPRRQGIVVVALEVCLLPPLSILTRDFPTLASRQVGSTPKLSSVYNVTGTSFFGLGSMLLISFKRPTVSCSYDQPHSFGPQEIMLTNLSLDFRLRLPQLARPASCSSVRFEMSRRTVLISLLYPSLEFQPAQIH